MSLILPILSVYSILSSLSGVKSSQPLFFYNLVTLAASLVSFYCYDIATGATEEVSCDESLFMTRISSDVATGGTYYRGEVPGGTDYGDSDPDNN